MNEISMKKKTDTVISDPLIRNEARRYSLRTQLAFLPDEVIGRSWFFRLLTLVYYNAFLYFHAFESRINLVMYFKIYLLSFLFFCIVVGIEKIDPNQGALFIARHSTHNGEILGSIVTMYHKSGRVLR